MVSLSSSVWLAGQFNNNMSVLARVFGSQADCEFANTRVMADAGRLLR